MGTVAVAALVAALSTADAQQVLPETVVTGDGNQPPTLQQTTAGPVDGYRALTSTSASKTETPLRELPQSVNVVPRKVIDDQGAVSQSEVLRNVSATRPLTPVSFGQLSPNVRGFPAERFVDGLPNYYDPGARDLLINVERIEVLKGPGSILYQGGANPIGGTVNIVSKEPTDKRFATVGVTVGSYGHVSPFFDINQPLTDNGTVLFRMTGQWERAQSHIDVLDRNSYTFNPTLTFTNKEGTSLTLQGNLSQRRQQDYSGLPATGTLDLSTFSIRRNLFPGTPDMPDTLSRSQSLTARFEHAFNEIWSTTTVARIGTGTFEEPAQFIFQFGDSNRPAVGSSYGFFNGYLGEETREVSISSNVVSRFQTGEVRHRVLFSVDYNRVSDKGQLYGDFVGFVDFADPIFPGYTRPVPGPLNTFIDADNRYRQMGATAQWQASAFDRLHLLAAVKLANVRIESNDLFGGANFVSDETKVLPRIGVAYEVFKGFTVFAGYSEGLRAVPFFAGANPPKAEGSRQAEAGVKFETGTGLSGSVAAFEITRSNVAVFDPANPGQQIQTGEQRSRGVEADLLWQPTRNWSVLTSAAYVDARVTEDTDPTLIDAMLVGVPRLSGRLWVNYDVTEGRFAGLSVGAGLTAASKQSVVLGDVFRTAGYMTVDARIGYKKDGWDFSITGKNLTNARYFEPYPYFDGRVIPGAPTTVYATVARTF
jgi:iron complex outermembrane receptor protein